MADIPQIVVDGIDEKLPVDTPDESQEITVEDVNDAVKVAAQYTADEVERLDGLIEDGTASLPAGGTTGQVLKKQSNADGDADWEDETGGGSDIELATPTTFTGSIKFDKLMRTYEANSSDISADITVDAAGAVDNGGARLVVTEDGGGEPTLSADFKETAASEPYDTTDGNATAYVFSNVAGTKLVGKLQLGVPVVTPTLSTPTFSADAISDTEIALTTIASDSDSEAMTIERATNSGFTTGLTEIYSGVPVTSFNDDGLTESTHYYYRIQTTAAGFIDSGYGLDDDTTDAAGLSPLNAPTSFAAGTPTAFGVPFTWNDTNTSPNESSGLIQITTAADTTYAAIVATRTPVADATSAAAGTGLSPNTAYRARMKYIGNGTTTADSGFSSQVTFTTAAATLNAPVLTAGTPTADGIPFTFTDTNTTPAESSGLIQITTAADTTYASVVATRTPAANATSEPAGTGLTDATAYRARMKWVGDGSTTLDSVYSNEVTFTTAALSYSAESLDYFARVATAGYTMSAGEKNAVEAFYQAISGHYSKYDEFGLFIGDTAASQVVGFKDAYNLTPNGATVHSATGYKGNGSSAWMDTGYNAGTNFGANWHVAIANRTTATTAGIDIGWAATTPGDVVIDTTTPAMVSTTAAPVIIGSSAGLGLYTAVHSAGADTFYRGSTSIGTGTSTYSGGGTLFISRNGASGSGYTDTEIYFWSVGDSLTSGEVATTATALAALKTALGR